MINTKINTNKNVDLVYKHKLTAAEIRELWLGRIVIYIGILIVLFPVAWVIGASLSKGDAFFSGKLFPEHPSLQNYTDLFKTQDIFFTTALKNSFIVCTAVSLIQLLMTATAAYAFSRMKFKGRKYGLMSLLVLQMFPGLMALSAIYLIMYKFELLDNIWALVILLAGGSAFNVWLLKGFIDGIPRELDEAAKVDGATDWQIFWKIIMPLSRPMLAVMFFFCFQGTYNEFPLSSVALKDPSNQTIAVALQSFISDKFSQHWTQFAAAAILAALPLMVIFMSLQKFIEKGLVAGAVKG